MEGLATPAFTVKAPARPAARRPTRGGPAATGASGYRLPASPRAAVADGVVPLAGLLARIPVGRGVTEPLVASLRDPALDRRDRALATGLRQLTNRL